MVSGARVFAFTSASACAGAVLSVTVARAGEPAVLELEWRAPAGCPSREVVLARVDQLLGEHHAVGEGVPLHASELVTLLPDGRFRSELAIAQAGGERTRVLEADSCAEVAEASAVVLALAISPDVEGASASVPMPVLAAPVAVPSAEPAGKTQPVARPDEGPPAARDRKNGTSLRFVAALGAAVDFALADQAAPGVTLAATFAWGPASGGVRGSFFPERSSSVPAEPSQGVNISLLAVAPVVCYEPFPLPVELAACAEFEVGSLHATGYGTPVHKERGSSWLAPGGGFGAAFPRRGRVRGKVGVDVLFPLNHTEFVLDGVGVPHTLPAVDPRPALWLEVAFP